MGKVSKKQNPDSKLSLGVALFLLGAVLMSGAVKPSRLQSTSFASEPVEISGFNSSYGEEVKTPRKIVIADLGIDIVVKPAQLFNGYWEVFEDSAGWGEGSGIPGEKGNQVIFAHAREGLFKPLKEIEVGTTIYVFTQDNWFSYEVSEIKEVLPNQTEVIKPTEDETLTLYTCSGFADSKRLIVVAKRNSD